MFKLPFSPVRSLVEKNLFVSECDVYDLCYELSDASSRPCPCTDRSFSSNVRVSSEPRLIITPRPTITCGLPRGICSCSEDITPEMCYNTYCSTYPTHYLPLLEAKKIPSKFHKNERYFEKKKAKNLRRRERALNKSKMFYSQSGNEVPREERSEFCRECGKERILDSDNTLYCRCWVPQSGEDNTPFSDPMVLMQTLFSKFSERNFGSLSEKEKHKLVIRFVNAPLVLYFDLRSATTFWQVYRALWHYTVHCEGEHNLQKLWPMLLVAFIQNKYDGYKEKKRAEEQDNNPTEGLMPQAGMFDNPFAAMRSKFATFEEIKSSPFFEKLQKFFLYALSLSIFENFGLTFDNLRYSKVEAEAIKQKFHSGPDFIMCLMDTVLFLLEKGYTCMKTGSFDPLYYEGGPYEKWFIKVMDIEREVLNLNTPAATMEIHTFLSELELSIEEGENYYKHALRTKSNERHFLITNLSKLKKIQGDLMTKEEAMKTRRAPVSFLLAGGTKVAKSFLTDLLFSHYSKVFGLKQGQENIYTRTCTDEYWSGFRTHMWGLRLDDIGFLNPALKTLDPSLSDAIMIVNNVPYCPPQAELSDKGKTPVRPRLVIGTTNSEHLNAHAYFSCSAAVQRRFPFVIVVTIKEQYKGSNGLLNEDLLPPIEPGEYANFWNFEIKRVVPILDQSNMARLESIDLFTDIYLFLDWFISISKQHERNQDKVDASKDICDKVELCDCFRPKKFCKCLQEQSGYISGLASTVITKMQLQYLQEKRHFAERLIYRTNEMSLWQRFVMYVMYVFLWFCTWNEFTIRWARKLGLFRFCLAFCSTYFVDEQNLGIIIRASSDVLVRGREYKLVACAIALITSMIGAYKLYKLSSTTKLEETLFMQGAVPSSEVGSPPHATENERMNPWKTEQNILNSVDVPSGTIGWKSLSLEEQIRLIGQNCVQFYFSCPGSQTKKPNKGFCVGGQLYITNNHAYAENTFDLEIEQEPISDGVTRNIKIKVTPNMIYRDAKYDLMAIWLDMIPPKKNLLNLFLKDKLSGVWDGYYIARGSDKLEARRVIAAKYVDKFEHNLFPDKPPVILARVDIETKKGDCGSILMMQTHYGPLLAGFHFLGSPAKQVGAVMLNQTVFNSIISRFQKLVVETGTPILSASTISYDLVNLHTKSPVRFIENGIATVYGSLSGFRSEPKSLVSPTMLSAEFQKRGYEMKFGRPMMTGWLPKRHALLEMVNIPHLINTSILNDCVKDYVDGVLDLLSDEDLKMLHVYDDFTAVNGAQGVAYIDGIVRGTSAGFPWKKTKKFFYTTLPAQRGLNEPIEFNEEIMNRVKGIQETYKRGEMHRPIFVGSLKDEPRKLKKCQSGQTRVFTGAPIDWSLVVRKYYLSFVRLLQNKKFVFESAPGTVAQSLEWQKLFEYLNEFGDIENKVAGDFAKFDKSMPSELILASFKVITDIQKKAGYTDEELKICWGIAYDIAFPTVDMFGDLIQFWGSNPSGHPLTVIVNCIANCLYMRYCFYSMRPSDCQFKFKDCVRLMTYGDDNIMGIDPNTKWFNHTTIQQALQTIGITYTMADKDAETVPYLKLSECSFLKRTWRYDVDIKAVVGPLDHESIEKMLLITVKSKSVCESAQMVDILSSACREYFWYGREIFENKKKMFQDIISETELVHYVKDSTFPEYWGLVSDFWTNSKQLGLVENSPLIQNQNSPIIDSYCHLEAQTSGVWIDNSSYVGVPQNLFLEKQQLDCNRAKFDETWSFQKIQLTRPQNTQTKYEVQHLPKKCDGQSVPKADLYIKYTYFEDVLKSYENTLECLKEHHLSETQYLIERIHRQTEKLVARIEKDKNCMGESFEMGPQSGEEMIEAEIAIAELSKRYNLVFSDQDTQALKILLQLSLEKDNGLDAEISEEDWLEIAKCLEEQSGEVIPTEESTGPGQIVKEVVTFLDEASGETDGFEVGNDKMALADKSAHSDLANYLSRPVQIYSFVWNESDATGANSGTFYPWQLYFQTSYIQSKLNNYAFLRCNLRLKIVINASPFYYGALLFSYLPNFGLTADSSAPAADNNYFVPYSQRPSVFIYPQHNQGAELTLPFLYERNWLNCQSATNLQNMGAVNTVNFTQLQSANGASGVGVTVRVFAWAEDVEISGPSIALAAQSGDEYGKRPVSSIASAVASAAGSLKRVPIIGQYATATETGANLIAKVASLFGFCNPPVIENTMPYRPSPFPQMASTELSYPVEKLTIDPKNELTIDNKSLFGLSSTDELSIKKITEHESFLIQTTWATTTAVDTTLFTTPVTPVMYRASLDTYANRIYMTPMCWLSQLFTYWRGDIIFRFKFIASPFHKGRARITFDPAGTAGSNSTTTANTTGAIFTHIVDLGEETDVSVRIPYNQALAWCTTFTANYTNQILQTSASPTFNYAEGVHNGMISLRVFTSLTAPVATSSVQVLIFVKAADLEFAGPSELPLWSTLAPQSGEEIVAGEVSAGDDHKFLVYHGEHITSIRQLLRRSNLSRTWSGTLGADYGFIYLRLNRFPAPYGYDAAGYDNATKQSGTGSYKFNYCQNTLLNYICPGYVGVRGAINHTFNVMNITNGANTTSHLRCYRQPSIGSNGVAISSGTITTSGAMAAQNLGAKSVGSAGTALTNCLTQAGLVVSNPMYSAFKMLSTDPKRWVQGANYDGSNRQGMVVEVMGKNGDTYLIDQYVAAGTDFNLVFFVSVPTFYIYNTLIPTAV